MTHQHLYPFPSLVTEPHFYSGKHCAQWGWLYSSQLPVWLSLGQRECCGTFLPGRHLGTRADNGVRWQHGGCTCSAQHPLWGRKMWAASDSCGYAASHHYTNSLLIFNAINCLFELKKLKQNWDTAQDTAMGLTQGGRTYLYSVEWGQKNDKSYIPLSSYHPGGGAKDLSTTQHSPAFIWNKS